MKSEQFNPQMIFSINNSTQNKRSGRWMDINILSAIHFSPTSDVLPVCHDNMEIGNYI